MGRDCLRACSLSLLYTWGQSARSGAGAGAGAEEGRSQRTALPHARSPPGHCGTAPALTAAGGARGFVPLVLEVRRPSTRFLLLNMLSTLFTL